MNEKLKETQQQRVALLNKVYEMSDGDADRYINGGEIAVALGFEDGDEDAIRSIANYLEGEGLIESIKLLGGFPGHIRLSHKGLVEIESALESPNEPTQHFMPVNILNIETMIGSNIQQGNVASQQTVISIEENLESKIEEFLKQIEENIPNLQLGTEAEKELRSDMATMSAQIGSPKPKTSILKESLVSIRRVLESAAGGAMSASLVAYGSTLIGHLS